MLGIHSLPNSLFHQKYCHIHLAQDHFGGSLNFATVSESMDMAGYCQPYPDQLGWQEISRVGWEPV
jgi:hypothetical protein